MLLSTRRALATCAEAAGRERESWSFLALLTLSLYLSISLSLSISICLYLSIYLSISPSLSLQTTDANQTTRSLSRAYLRHLRRAKEPVLGTYMAHHNLVAMFSFMQDVRDAIFRDEI